MANVHFGFRIPMISLPIGIILQIISVASPYWIKFSVKIASIHVGLWKGCVDSVDLNISKCDPTDTDTGIV